MLDCFCDFCNLCPALDELIDAADQRGDDIRLALIVLCLIALERVDDLQLTCFRVPLVGYRAGSICLYRLDGIHDRSMLTRKAMIQAYCRDILFFPFIVRCSLERHRDGVFFFLGILIDEPPCPRSHVCSVYLFGDVDLHIVHIEILKHERLREVIAHATILIYIQIHYVHGLPSLMLRILLSCFLRPRTPHLRIRRSRSIL